MKKVLLFVFALTLLAALPSAAQAIDDLDGAAAVKLGWFQMDDSSSAGGAQVDFDAALALQADYDWYMEGGTRAWNVSFLYTNPDATLGAWSGDADVWQLAVNHKWYVSTEQSGPRKGWYLGAGLGYSNVDVSLSLGALTVSDDDNTLDINALGGYAFDCGALAEMLWVVDESNLGLSVGYRF